MKSMLNYCLIRRLGSRVVASALGLWLSTAIAGDARGSRGISATVNPLATDAAMDAFRKGGNAVDAAVAAALTLGVVDGHNSGIGGGCFLLIRLADGAVLAIDGRESAPSRATPAMFIRDGKGDPELSQNGALAVGVPGALLAYEYASRNYGKFGFTDTLLQAARIADGGFLIDQTYAQRIASVAGTLKESPTARVILFNPEGDPLKKGDRLKQGELAETYRAIANLGSEWFYRGPFAEMKLAFADRAHWLGDPDFVRVPRALVSKTGKTAALEHEPNDSFEGRQADLLGWCRWRTDDYQPGCFGRDQYD